MILVQARIVFQCQKLQSPCSGSITNERIRCMVVHAADSTSHVHFPSLCRQDCCWRHKFLQAAAARRWVGQDDNWDLESQPLPQLVVRSHMAYCDGLLACAGGKVRRVSGRSAVQLPFDWHGMRHAVCCRVPVTLPERHLQPETGLQHQWQIYRTSLPAGCGAVGR